MIQTPEAIAKSVGGRLKSFRRERGLTQEDLAARLTTSGEAVSAKTVSHWETGRTALTIPDLWPLARAFGVTTGYLGNKLGLCGESTAREERYADLDELLRATEDWPHEAHRQLVEMVRAGIGMLELGRTASSS